MADVDSVLADIESGGYDKDLPALLKAVNDRADRDEIEVGWRVELGDLIIDKTNTNGHGLTIGEVIALNELGCFNLELLNPVVSDADKLRVVLAHFMFTDGVKKDAAAKKIGEQQFEAIKVSQYTEPAVPKADTPPAST